MSPQQIQGIAQELLQAHDQAGLIASIAARDPEFDLDAAYQVAAELMRVRRSRGSRPVGRKIGFTPQHLGALWRGCADVGARV